MEKLKLKPNVTAKEARSHPSLALVYICPKCGVGKALRHFSVTTGKVECTICKQIYEKP